MITIVLFEDNKSLRQSLTRYFNNTDEVFLAGAYENAYEAVAKIRKHRPEVVLMDIQMPGLSGIEAMQRILTVEACACLTPLPRSLRPSAKKMVCRTMRYITFWKITTEIFG